MSGFGRRAKVTNREVHQPQMSGIGTSPDFT